MWGSAENLWKGVRRRPPGWTRASGFWGMLGFRWAEGGEYLQRNSIKESIKPALWSFIGIAMSWLIKIALCIILWGYIIIEAIHIYS